MQLPELAFDHKLIVREAYQQLAKQPELKQSGHLVSSLQRGAEQLAGPWTPPTG